MTFQIKEIDHALEWIIRDEVIRKGYWPAQRAFLANNDEAGYQAALNEYDNSSFSDDFEPSVSGLRQKIEVFGTANYKDRKQLKRNNCIIERRSVKQGDVGFSFPFHFVRQPDLSFKRFRAGEGLYNIEYEVRFVCNDIDLDRDLSQIMVDAFGQHKTIPGLTDGFLPTADTFFIVMNGDPVDLSGTNYIERVYRYMVMDVELQEEKEVETAAMLQEVSTKLNATVDGEQVILPEDANDFITLGSYKSSDYFRGLVEDIDAFRSMDRINIYAQVDAETALAPVKGSGASVQTVDSVFTVWKGFSKAIPGAFINTLFDRSRARAFQFNYCSYTFILMTAPGGPVDIAGHVDGVSDFLVRGDDAGVYVKMNTLVEAKMMDNNFQRLKVYVLNKTQSNILELWEDGEMIRRVTGEVITAPAAGTIYELNINGGASTVITGELGFSSYGPGLKPSQVKTWSAQVKAYFLKLGYQ